MRPELIGHSEEGRPISVLFAGDEAASLRILIVAGQHGDERRGREAVRRFARAGPASSVPVSLALVPAVNRDGAARGTRTNARGVDLNRDHLRLASAETRALHRFVRAWRPHLIVDVHDFPPRRRHLLAQHLVYCQDVFLDVPTHPAAQHPALGREGGRLLRPILSALDAAGYRTARYTRVTKSGRVRHSTPDVVDARNGLALRYGLPTVLVEGRGPARQDDAAVEARVLAGLEKTLSLIVRWAQENRARLTDAPPPARPAAGESVPVRTRYVPSSRPCALAFADARSGAIRKVEVPGRFTPELEAGWPVSLPEAYAVPRAQGALLELLRRHSFALVPPRPGRVERIERYWVETVEPSHRPNRPPRELQLRVGTEHRPLDDYLLVPVTQDAGPALAVYLEPASKHGLARLAALELRLTPQSAYPVLRVLKR